MWPKLKKRSGQAFIAGLLPGFAALSLLLGGWLLGYGLGPSISDLTKSLQAKPNSGKFSTTVPVYRQDWARSSDGQRIRSSAFDK